MGFVLSLREERVTESNAQDMYARTKERGEAVEDSYDDVKLA